MSTDKLFDNLQFCHRQVIVDEAGKRHIESLKANKAFWKFCELGAERSVQRVATELAKSRTLISRWCQKWAWRERVREYDAKMREAEVAGYAEARRQMVDRHAKLAVMSQGIVEVGIMEMQKRLARVGRKRNLTPNELSKLLKVSTDLERKVRGEPGHDGNDTTIIRVFLELQQRPRYEDAAAELTRADDPAKDYDS